MVEKDISYGIWLLLNRTRELIAIVRRKELNKHGITTRQSIVLRAILRLGHEATPARISKEVYLAPSSISEQLKRMEIKGLIRRVKDLDKKNLIRAEVTGKGYELFSKLSKRETIKNVINTLSNEDQLELWRILVQMRKKALDELAMQNSDIYPPDNPEELWEKDL
ncbi:MarR family winged helix-turn-helix transcriptional regulator [Chloroflexota bacterium]